VWFGGVQGPPDMIVFEHREERFRHAFVRTHAGTAYGLAHPRAGHQGPKSAEA
jgi:hypothetical protein